MKTVFTKSTSLLLAACFAAAAGGSLAAPTPVNDRLIVAQAPTQDPNTPPDCKKYPKDTRCKDK